MTSIRVQPRIGRFPHKGLIESAVKTRVPRIRLLAKDLFVILATVDFVLVSVSAFLGAIGYQVVASGQVRDVELYIAVSAGLAGTTVMTMILDGSYSIDRQLNEGKFSSQNFFRFNSAFSILICILFLTHLTDLYSRGSLFTQFFTGFGGLVLGRAAAEQLISAAINQRYLEAQRVGLIGTAQAISAFMLQQPEQHAVRFSAFELPDWAVYPSGVADEDELRGIIAHQIHALRASTVEEVIILLPEQARDLTRLLMHGCTHLPVGLNLLLDHEIFNARAIEVRRFGRNSAVKLCRPPLSVLDQVAKRIFDLIVASAALISLAPLMAFIALAIRIDSDGPVLFRQMRHGYNQKPFRITKFRTMTTLEDGAVFRQATANDTRITAVGRLLRRTNLDELPQLFDVLRGEMSLVGPRPHAIAHDWEFESKIPSYARRHNIKPGLTGWAQVNGLRGETDTDEKMQARIEHDLYYIDHWSLMLDIRIMITTVISAKAYRNAR